MKIAIGIARGLKYLHTEVEPPFTISELNSSAVYLTEEFSPKVHALASSNLQIYQLQFFSISLEVKNEQK